MSDEGRAGHSSGRSDVEMEAEEPVDADSNDLAMAGLRAGLRQFETKSTAVAVWLFVVDAATFVLCFAALMRLPWSVWAKLPLAALQGIVITRIFILGHDAAHGALTGSRIVNAVIGRAALLPSLHPYSLWQLGHNRVHHAFTNLKGVDFIWIPLSPDEYRALPCWRRIVERGYRSIFGFGAYYLVEIWWKYLSPTALRALRDFRREHALDIALVLAFLVLEIAIARGAVVEAVILPFLCWNWLMGFLIYNHHTHPSVRFFNRRSEWRFFEGQIKGTVHVIFPWALGPLFHYIMEHTAHHFDVKIPLYRLRAAQQFLEERLGADLVVEQWSIARFLDTVSACQLYDYDRGRWIRFTEVPPPCES
jgi:omega-6 fatty acid desaturase (delta-12 desaturase)